MRSHLSFSGKQVDVVLVWKEQWRARDSIRVLKAGRARLGTFSFESCRGNEHGSYLFFLFICVVFDHRSFEI